MSVFSSSWMWARRSWRRDSRVGRKRGSVGFRAWKSLSCSFTCRVSLSVSLLLITYSDNAVNAMRVYVYLLMLPPIPVRHLPPPLNTPLHRRINHQLLRHRMPRQHPRKLILGPRLLVRVAGFENQIAEGHDLAVVFFEGFEDAEVERWVGGLVGVGAKLVCIYVVEEGWFRDAGAAGRFAGCGHCCSDMDWGEDGDGDANANAPKHSFFTPGRYIWPVVGV